MAEIITEPTKGPTQAEILQAQLEIAEAKVIQLTAEKAGLEAQIAEQTRLLQENVQAQTVLTKASAELSTTIHEKELALLEIPEGLTATETQALKDTRQKEIDTLKATQEKYKTYIRGEL